MNPVRNNRGVKINLKQKNMFQKLGISNGVNNQKGVSLYISIIIMVIILSIVFGVTTILLGQLKVIKGIESSVVAFYAAESGIEQTLMNRLNPVSLNGALTNGATYDVMVDSLPSPDYFSIKSKGFFLDAQRTIQVAY